MLGWTRRRSMRDGPGSAFGVAVAFPGLGERVPRKPMRLARYRIVRCVRRLHLGRDVPIPRQKPLGAAGDLSLWQRRPARAPCPPAVARVATTRSQCICSLPCLPARLAPGTLAGSLCPTSSATCAPCLAPLFPPHAPRLLMHFL